MTRTKCLVRWAGRAILMGLAFSLVLLGAGCGTLDQGPDTPAGETIEESGLAAGQEPRTPDGGASIPGGFYPLTIGNTWVYAGEITITIDGGSPSVTPTREVYSLIGTEERFGREYMLEKRFNIDEDGDTLSPLWFRQRQDRAGLYTADIAGSEPPLYEYRGARRPGAVVERWSERSGRIWREIETGTEPGTREAYRKAWEDLCLKLSVIEAATGGAARFGSVFRGPPGGVFPEEITRLKYPLHPSQHWTIRDDPFFAFSTVEAHEVLDLPPGRMNGYRIRIDSDLYGPNDRVHIWYGRDGYLGASARLELEVRDHAGNPIGLMVFEEQTFLESLDLVGKGKW